MVFALILLPVLGGIPAPALQGDWHVLRVRIHDSWEPCCGGNAFEAGENTWRIRGTWIGATFDGRTVRKQLALIPAHSATPAGPFEVRYTDFDGRVYSGSYSAEGGKVVLTLRGRAPIPGVPNTEGSREMTITLERQASIPPRPGAIASGRSSPPPPSQMP